MCNPYKKKRKFVISNFVDRHFIQKKKKKCTRQMLNKEAFKEALFTGVAGRAFLLPQKDFRYVRVRLQVVWHR